MLKAHRIDAAQVRFNSREFHPDDGRRSADAMRPPMTKILRLAGLTLFIALAAFYVAFGVLYASVRDLLWFHAAAVPGEALSAVRPLYLALMKLIGGATAAFGLLGGFVALTAIRRGERPAAIALFIANAIPLTAAAFVAETLASKTGAPTSWHIMGALFAVDFLALAGVLAGRRRPLKSGY